MRWVSTWMIAAVGLVLTGVPADVAAQENVNVDSTESPQECPSDSSPRYRVIDVPLIVGKDNVVSSATLSKAAACGYRIVNAAPFGRGLTVLLERSPKPLNIYDYVILAPKKPSNLSMELDAAGAKGFRLHSRCLIRVIGGKAGRVAVLMEKAPGPPMRYRYRLLAGKKFPMLQIEMARVSEQGEAVVGLTRGKKTIAIVEKRAKMKTGSLAAQASESPRQERRSYLLLDTRKISSLRKELEQAAAAGYRIVNAPGGTRTLLLEKEISSPEGREYLLLANHRMSAMQTELNAAAAKGFRLLPRTVAEQRRRSGGSRWSGFGLTDLVLDTVTDELNARAKLPVLAVVERNTGAKTRYDYLVLDTLRRSTLQRELTEASKQGYEAVALQARSIFMERPADSRLPASSSP